MRKIVLAFLMIASCLTRAQEYKVYNTIGGPIVITKDGQFAIKKRDLLTPLSEIHIPYNSSLELFDEANHKQYILKTPGRGTVGNMLKNKQNGVISLSDRYFQFIVAQMNSKDINRTVSDGSNITRDSLSVTINNITVNKEMETGATSVKNSPKRKIVGVVVDENSSPIIGASVVLKGTSLKQITDINGRFEFLDAPASAKTIEASYTGYVAKEVAVTDNVRIVLAELPPSQDQAMLWELIDKYPNISEPETDGFSQSQITIVSGPDLNEYSVTYGYLQNQKDAENLKIFLDNQGYNTTVIFKPDENIYGVIIASFSNEYSAVESYYAFKSRYPNRADIQKHVFILWRLEDEGRSTYKDAYERARQMEMNNGRQ